jgi:hypothetical protein
VLILRASPPPHWQTPLFIKSCSRIAQILLFLPPVLMVHLQWSFPPLEEMISTMDLDSDYYLSRCKDINGLWEWLKGHFWVLTFVGGDSFHATVPLFYNKGVVSWCGGGDTLRGFLEEGPANTRVGSPSSSSQILRKFYGMRTSLD